jgi:membrane associated rhomboid family serine protease
MQPPPPVTRALMIASFVVFLLLQIPELAHACVTWLALFPVQSGFFWPWQLLTYPFLHFDFVQLLFNLLALWMFGIELEQLWGERRYIQFLLASGLAGAVTYVVLAFMFPAIPFTGLASVVFGLLLAFGMLFPHRPILVFMVWPTTMRNATIVFGAMVLVFAVLQRGAGAATSVAHLGGMLGAWLMLLWWRRRPPRFRRVK